MLFRHTTDCWFLRFRIPTLNSTQLQKPFGTLSIATMSSVMRKKRATTQTSLDIFFFHFFRRENRVESNKEPESVLSTSGMSGIAACLPSPIVDDTSPCHHPPPLPSPVGCFSALLTGFQPLDSSHCTALLRVSKRCTVRFKIFSLFFCICFFFMLSFVWKVLQTC